MNLAEASEKFPIGKKITFRPVSGRAEQMNSQVISHPWELGGRIVVKIANKSGGVDVEHLEVR